LLCYYSFLIFYFRLNTADGTFEWEDSLDGITLEYNSSCHTTHGMSPWSVEKGTDPPTFSKDPEYALVASANQNKKISHEDRMKEVAKRLKNKAGVIKEKFVKSFLFCSPSVQNKPSSLTML